MKILYINQAFVLPAGFEGDPYEALEIFAKYRSDKSRKSLGASEGLTYTKKENATYDSAVRKGFKHFIGILLEKVMPIGGKSYGCIGIFDIPEIKSTVSSFDFMEIFKKHVEADKNLNDVSRSKMIEIIGLMSDEMKKTEEESKE